MANTAGQRAIRDRRDIFHSPAKAIGEEGVRVEMVDRPVRSAIRRPTASGILHPDLRLDPAFPVLS